mgnify:CR=1 FL=1
MKLINHTFRFRALGDWINQTTDDLFADKKLFYLVYLVHLHLLALHNNYLAMKVHLMSLKNLELTRYIVCQSTMLLL